MTRGEFGSLSRALNESGTVCKVCYWELPELFLVNATYMYDSI